MSRAGNLAEPSSDDMFTDRRRNRYHVHTAPGALSVQCFQIVCSRLHQRELPLLDFEGFLASAPVSRHSKWTPCVRVQLCTGAQECRRVSHAAAAVPLPYNETRARSQSLCLQQKRMRSAPFSDAAKSQLFPFCLCFVLLSTQYFSLITLARLM